MCSRSDCSCSRLACSLSTRLMAVVMFVGFHHSGLMCAYIVSMSEFRVFGDEVFQVRSVCFRVAPLAVLFRASRSVRWAVDCRVVSVKAQNSFISLLATIVVALRAVAL